VKDFIKRILSILATILYIHFMIGEVTDKRKDQLFSALEIFTIVALASVPLFITFPFRVNIYLSWDGAYRLSKGQIPFKDFGMPLGYMYWVIPAIFFKIFGPQLITLVKAQVLINILSGMAFRSIFKSLAINSGVRFLAVLLYCISFSFFNFWPWYNHTVIVYEMISIAFLMKYLFSENKKWIWISLSALFVFFSFFTKQDGGALTFMICLALLIYYSTYEKKWSALIVFLLTTIIVAFAMIAPLMRFKFGYWFNFGQAPHTSRVSIFDIVDEFLYSSQWIKFYLLVIAVILFASYKSLKQFVSDKKNFIFFLLTAWILVEAAVLQVTSYTPPDSNIFFHSFAFAFICSAFVKYFNLNLYKLKSLFIICFLLILWWSGVFWKYIQNTVQSAFMNFNKQEHSTENIVNRHTYILYPPSDEIPMNEWTFSELKSFRKILMPKKTVDGINRLLKMPIVKNNKNLHVLNMTELTPLAVEMPYHLETGSGIPLWYHLGVGMFNKEAEMYEEKIVNNQYDLILFEYIPSVNNFYPFRVRDILLHQYNKIDSFPAPRRGFTQGIIEVFVKKNP
jgi:hypothetical protein